VADRAYASLKVLDQCRKLSRPITFITGLRLDGALYKLAPPRHPHSSRRPSRRCVGTWDSKRRGSGRI
jgi:hypothetical protein